MSRAVRRNAPLPHDSSRGTATLDARRSLLYAGIVAALTLPGWGTLPLRAQPPLPGPSDPAEQKRYAEDFHPQVRGNGQGVPELVPFGPDAASCVKYEPQGLRITLPPGSPRQRAGTGVVTDFGVRGDFELTLQYTLLTDARPGDGGNPTELRLVAVPREPVEPEVWHKANQNRALLARQLAGPTSPGHFHADATQWNAIPPKDKWGNENFTHVEVHHSRRALALAKSGRMRLVRNGSTLAFFAADDGSREVLLHEHEFGTKDLKNVRVLGSTGGPAAALDLWVTDFRIRADGFVRTPAAEASRAGPAPSRSRSVIILGLTCASALAALLAVWLGWPRRSRPTEFRTVVASEPTAIVFACAGCGRRLRAKSERAGTRLPCPQCGQAVDVPKLESASPEESP